MKSIIQISLIIFCCNFVFSQQELLPPTLDLEGVEVNWIYLVEDTNFVERESSSATRFSACFFRSLAYDDGYVYLFNQSIRAAIDFDGFDLYKLDSSDGSLVYSLNYDYDGGAENYYTFNSLSKMDFGENDIIEILGYQSIDTIISPSDFELPILAYYGRPAKFEIESNDLSIHNVQVGLGTNVENNNVYNFISPNSDDLIKGQNGNYIHLSKTVISEDGFIKSKVYLYDVDENLSIDSNRVNEIVYNSNIQSNQLELGFPTWYKLPNDSTLITLNISKSLPDITQSPEAALLSIYNIASFEDVDLKTSVDVTDLFYKDDNVYDFSMDTISNHIFLTQTSFDQTQSPSNLNTHSWLACFDFNGELMYSLKDFGDNDLSYEYLSPLILEDDILIFSATYTLPDSTGFDLFRVSFDSLDPPVKISRISQANDESFVFKRLLTPVNIADNNYVIPILGLYQYRDDDTKMTKMYYLLSVDFSDDILDSNYDVQTIGKFDYTLSPNPVADQLSINFKELFNGQVEIYSPNGVLLFEKKIRNEVIVTFNMSNLPGGAYIVKVKDEMGEILKTSIFFKS